MTSARCLRMSRWKRHSDDGPVPAEVGAVEAHLDDVLGPHAVVGQRGRGDQEAAPDALRQVAGGALVDAGRVHAPADVDHRAAGRRGSSARSWRRVSSLGVGSARLAPPLAVGGEVGDVRRRAPARRRAARAGPPLWSASSGAPEAVPGLCRPEPGWAAAPRPAPGRPARGVKLPSSTPCPRRQAGRGSRPRRARRRASRARAARRRGRRLTGDPAPTGAARETPSQARPGRQGHGSRAREPCDVTCGSAEPPSSPGDQHGMLTPGHGQHARRPGGRRRRRSTPCHGAARRAARPASTRCSCRRSRCRSTAARSRRSSARW